MAVALSFSFSSKVVFFYAFAIISLIAMPISSTRGLVEYTSQTYIVHMDISAMPKPFSGHDAWYSSLLSSLSSSDVSTTINSGVTPSSTTAPKLIYSYSNSINGFTATLTPSQLEALKTSPAYISSAPDRILRPHTTRTPSFLGLQRGSGAWKAGNYGDGVIIGLVDSGIWPESASFKDEGMSKPPSRWKGKCVADSNFRASNCNNKIIGARFYNKGFQAQYSTLTISMNSTRDIEGHGTHTSSTAAGTFVDGSSYFGYANGTAVGMAPRAWIAVYKVFWDEIIAESDALAAIDQAIEDGVDILSLSFSFGDSSLNVNPISIASFTAMKKGIFVAVSAGNDGSDGYGGLGNGIPWAVTVGAGTMDRDLYGILTLGNGVKIRFPSWYPGDHAPRNKPLVVRVCDNADDFLKFRSYIVVCTYHDLLIQTGFARTTNATTAVFISERAVLLDDTRTEFPSAFILYNDGQTVIDYVNKTRHPIASMEFQKTELGVKPAPRVDVYSSRGPSPASPYVLKPDIIAPGTSVLAAWPSKTPVSQNYVNHFWYSDYNVLYGTSMATAHIAGVAALVKAVHPHWSPAAIRSALMTTADIWDNTDQPIKLANYNVTAIALEIGAGQVNPNRALDPGLVYNTSAEDYVQLLCGMGFSPKDISKITRSPYKCLKQSSLDLNYPSFIAYFNDLISAPDIIVQVFQRTVTNVGEGKSKYSAKVTPLKGLKVKVEPEELVFNHKYEKQSYNLTLEGPKAMSEYYLSGYLSWVSEDGKYVVRSPILATRRYPGQGPENSLA